MWPKWRILYACGGGEQKTSQSGTRNNNGSSPGWSTRMPAPRPGTSWFNTAKSTLCLSSNTKSRPTLTYAEARKTYVRQTHVDRARTVVGSRYTKTNDIHIRLRCVPLDRMRFDSATTSFPAQSAHISTEMRQLFNARQETLQPS